MGMFDYICVEGDVELPQLPQQLIDKWGGKTQIAFQTKATPIQAMRKYVIGNEGVLYLFDYDSRFEEDDSPFGATEHRDNERLEATNFNGSINFYEPLFHEDYCLDSHDRFEFGWVEYYAVFKGGVLQGEIELDQLTLPLKLDDAQYQKKLDDREKTRKEIHDRMFAKRKNNPTYYEKVIDNIAREVKLATSIPTMEDYGRALNNIELHIKEYRENNDPFYQE